jgi:hypothetical protein
MSLRDLNAMEVARLTHTLMGVPGVALRDAALVKKLFDDWGATPVQVLYGSLLLESNGYPKSIPALYKFWPNFMLAVDDTIEAETEVVTALDPSIVTPYEYLTYLDFRRDTGAPSTGDATAFERAKDAMEKWNDNAVARTFAAPISRGGKSSSASSPAGKSRSPRSGGAFRSGLHVVP